MNAPPPLARHAQVLDAMRLLHEAATALFLAYDFATPLLDDEQPPEMTEVLPMALDEWCLTIARARKAWARIATPQYLRCFPRFAAEPLPPIPAWWRDASYINDSCPSWAVGDLQIYIAEFRPEDREHDYKRFFVLDNNAPENTLIQGETETDWHEIVRFVSERILAQKFASELRRQIGDEKVGRVIERNVRRGNSCASHDFCDANMVMDAAWRELFGASIDLNDETQCKLWSDAWTRAKQSAFAPFPKH